MEIPSQKSEPNPPIAPPGEAPRGETYRHRKDPKRPHARHLAAEVGGGVPGPSRIEAATALEQPSRRDDACADGVGPPGLHGLLQAIEQRIARGGSRVPLQWTKPARGGRDVPLTKVVDERIQLAATVDHHVGVQE